MSELNIADVVAGELSVRVARTETGISLLFSGTADVRAFAPLEELLPKVHDEAVKMGGREVVVDLKALEFMNSSCLKTFVSWLSRLEETPPAQQYTVRLLSDPAKHWQKRSLSALSCFAFELVRVES